MLKTDLEILINSARENVAEILQRARGQGGSCRFCCAMLGQQHYQYCVVWPFIMWRQQFNELNQDRDDEIEGEALLRESLRDRHL